MPGDKTLVYSMSFILSHNLIDVPFENNFNLNQAGKTITSHNFSAILSELLFHAFIRILLLLLHLGRLLYWCRAFELFLDFSILFFFEQSLIVFMVIFIFAVFFTFKLVIFFRFLLYFMFNGYRSFRDYSRLTEI